MKYLLTLILLTGCGYPDHSDHPNTKESEAVPPGVLCVDTESRPVVITDGDPIFTCVKKK